MNSEEAKHYVKGQLEDYLARYHPKIKTRGNFKCLNLDHKDKHPSMSIDKKSKSGPHCNCFRCGAYYDTFDLIGIDFNISDMGEVYKKGYELYGLKVEGCKSNANEDFLTLGQYHNKPKTEPQPLKEVEEAKEIDINEMIGIAHLYAKSRPEILEHFYKRGLSQEIIKKYRLGYATGGHNDILAGYKELHSNSRKQHLYKFVLPYLDRDDRACYFQTEIIDRSQIDDYNSKYRKPNSNGGKYPGQIWNERYLMEPQPFGTVFICEGIYDALSVEDAGGAAIALGGVGTNRLKDLLEKHKPSLSFIIGLDGDQAGQAAAEKIKEVLAAQGYTYIEGPPPGTAKDYNEALTTSREGFIDFVNDSIESLEDQRREKERREKEKYLETSAFARMLDFDQAIEDSKTLAFFPSCFSGLDNILDGGFYPGLYIIGARSSLGKTTFSLQIVDNIAAQEQDILIFSLEMGRNELIAKSISRLTLLEAIRQTGNTRNAKTDRGVLTGARYAGYSRKDVETIDAAKLAYMDYCQHIYIYEATGNIGVAEVRERVAKHIKITGNKPIVLIDYIQILAPADIRATDKRNMDIAVSELKRISRDFNITVIGISSINRESYDQPIDMSSYKESGAIEYGSDVVIGLQYEGWDYRESEGHTQRKIRLKKIKKDNIAKGKNRQGIRVEIKILKNRKGSQGESIIEFFPMFNYFVEPSKKPKALGGSVADSIAGERPQRAGEEVAALFEDNKAEPQGLGINWEAAEDLPW